MTRLRLEFRDEALQEVIAAYRWYAEKSQVAAESFSIELEEALDTILDAPDRWPPYTTNTRRYLVKRFPYLVFYRIVDDRLVVMAVAHGRRMPGYWRNRNK